MIYRLLGALLRFAHREGWLLRLADYFDPAEKPRHETQYADFTGVKDGQHTAE